MADEKRDEPSAVSGPDALGGQSKGEHYGMKHVVSSKTHVNLLRLGSFLHY